MNFFDTFRGKGGSADTANAYAASRAELTAGTDQGIAAYNKGADEAKGYYAPWAERGAKQQGVYEDSLGLNGAAGGQNALFMYQNGRNPHLDYEQGQAQKAIERSANARGGLNTGYTALASARARQGLGYQDYQGWQNRLMQNGQMGYGADQARAGIAQQAGQYAGDARIGLGQQLAGNAINYGNAQASNRMTGINNLMKLGGMAISASGVGSGYGGMPTQYGGMSPGGVRPGQNWSQQ